MTKGSLALESKRLLCYDCFFFLRHLFALHIMTNVPKKTSLVGSYMRNVFFSITAHFYFSFSSVSFNSVYFCIIIYCLIGLGSPMV